MPAKQVDKKRASATAVSAPGSSSKSSLDLWRTRLLGVAIVACVAINIWLFVISPVEGRAALTLLSCVFGVGMRFAFQSHSETVTDRLVTANVALGCLVLLGASFVVSFVVALEAKHDWVPDGAVKREWLYFFVATVGAASVLWTWRYSSTSHHHPVTTTVLSADAVLSPMDPPPPSSKSWSAPVDWATADRRLQLRDDAIRRHHLMSLKRIDEHLQELAKGKLKPEDVQRTVRQEAQRLGTQSAAAEHAAESDDVLTQAASIVEWGVQKIPELVQLDASDLVLAKAVADINRFHKPPPTRKFIDHRQLSAIHPIDRGTADAKCNERAAQFQAALPIIKANGMRLSEDLIAGEEALSSFRSLSGFQVVAVPGVGFVTFEGNGRREALHRALTNNDPSVAVLVECRVYEFEDETTRQTIARRVQRVREWKHVDDGSARRGTQPSTVEKKSEGSNQKKKK